MLLLFIFTTLCVVHEMRIALNVVMHGGHILDRGKLGGIIFDIHGHIVVLALALALVLAILLCISVIKAKKGGIGVLGPSIFGIQHAVYIRIHTFQIRR